MRAVLPILLIVLGPAAVAQASKTPDDERAAVPAPNAAIDRGVRFPEDTPYEEVVEELAKQGVYFERAPACVVDYSDIEAEERASDARRRAMRDTVIPLKDQYEQELYYRERRERRFTEICGETVIATNADKAIGLKFRSLVPERIDMTRKACEAIGVVCKPVKHW